MRLRQRKAQPLFQFQQVKHRPLVRYVQIAIAGAEAGAEVQPRRFPAQAVLHAAHVFLQIGGAPRLPHGGAGQVERGKAAQAAVGLRAQRGGEEERLPAAAEVFGKGAAFKHMPAGLHAPLRHGDGQPPVQAARPHFLPQLCLHRGDQRHQSLVRFGVAQIAQRFALKGRHRKISERLPMMRPAMSGWFIV